MTFAIHVIGRSREKWLQDAEAEYAKRLSAWGKVEWTTHRAEDPGSGANADEIRRVEGTRLLSGLTDREMLVALDEGGRSFTSEDLARWLESRLGEGVSRFRFALGGATGLHDDLCKKAKLVLSLSPMTFTHQMARLVLIEQLYRAMMIRDGRPYHRS